MKDLKIKSTTGSVSITYSVTCPHCEEYLNDYCDCDWWENSIFMDDGWDGTWEVECPKCNKQFNIEGFQH